MKYDPVKRSLGKVFNSTPFLRKIFYSLLDLLLLRAWHIKKELKIWAKNIKTDASILDAGAGFGQYVYTMSKLNSKFTIKGVDVKAEQIDDCNKFFTQINESHRISFEEADLQKYKNPDSYNLILSVDVMEHIEDDVQVFRNFHESLKKDGMLLISTPSDQGGSDTHHEHDHEHDEDGEAHGFIDEHVRDGYNKKDIEDKLILTGFKDIEVYYAYGKYGKIAWKLSMKYPITMLNITKLFFILLPFYFIITYPISYILNYLDVNNKNETGTGLIVRAYKR